MNHLKLDDSYALTIEPDGSRVRLVIYKNGIEEVCRKEYPGKLLRFVRSDEERIFKGRLQLFKTESGIGIEVKKSLVAVVPADSFLEQVQNADNVLD